MASMPATISADPSSLFFGTPPRFQDLMSDGPPEHLQVRRPRRLSRGASGPYRASSANSARQEPDTTPGLRRRHHDNATPAHGLTPRSAEGERSRACCATINFGICRDQRTHADVRTCGPDAFGLHQERTTTTLPDARPSPT
jgi:hypothetical protein